MTTRKLGSIKLTDNVLVPNVALGSEVTGILGVANGGTGQSVYTDGQLLIGNTTGNTLNKATLTAGTGITITNGAGAITIATSIIGSQWLNSGSDIYFSSGNVAIGTTPSASIELLLRGGGATNATFSLSTENSAATNTFFVRDDGAVGIPNGNLGIGTSPTAQRLQVNGTTTISGQLTLSQASGTAPMVVTSTTRVANLNVATAGTADQLTTARTINGVSFNGTANITVAAAAGTLTGTTLASGVTASSLTSVGTLTSLAVSGNASVGPISSGADGLNVAVTRNLTFGEGSSNSYLNLFRQANSGGTVLANGYKYSATADGFASSTSVAWAKSAIRLANGDIQFYADASTTVANGTDATPSPRVIIGRAGRVGIGTTNPATLLDVTGGFGTSTTAFTIYNNTAFNAANIAQIDFRVNNSFGGNERVASITALNPNAAANNGGALVFSVSANGTATTPTEDMRIDAAGNVGIGTTSPATALHLLGTLTVGNSTYSRPALTPTNWGYSSSYRVMMVGSASTSYTTQNTGAVTVAFNYDPSGNANGSFNGDGREILFRNGTQFVTPNAANTSYNLSNLVLVDGNVGIGTTSPSEKFEVYNGGLSVSNGTIKTVISYNTVGVIGMTSNHALSFITNNAERARIDASGNVGIGTTSPQSRFHVFGGDIMRTNSDYVNGSAGSGFVITGLASSGATDAQLYAFRGGNTSYGNIVIPGGNLGIGTTSPNASLDVQGNYITVHNNTTSINTICANLSLANKGTVSTTGPDAGARIVAITGSGNWFDSTQMAFYTHPGPDVTAAASVERMRITGAGNVGIGTTSPDTKLHVSAADTNGLLRLARTGTVAGSGILYANGNEMFGVTDGTLYPFLVKQGAPTESLVVASSGNVGIGTTSPSLKLHVAGDVQIGESSGGEKLRFVGATNKTNWQIGKQINVDNGFEITPSTAAGGTTFSTPAFAITNSGNVGIGTTSPSNLLHLKASSNPVLRLEGASDSGYVDYNGTRLQLSAGGGAIYFVSGNSEKSRLTSAGDWFVGTTTSWSSARFVSERNSTSVPAAEFNGTGQTAGLAPVYIWNNAESGSTYFISFYSDGVNNPRTLRGYINYRRDNATLNLTTASDYRIKTIHGAYTKSGEVFDKIQVHEGTINGESGKYPMVLAHELAEAYPSAVDGEKDAVNEDGTPKLQMVSYTAMIPVMLAEIKSLRERVAQLERQ